MKKLVHYFIFVVLFSIFFSIQSVFAAEHYEINYEITSFNVTSDKISFEGWSFLTHMDNYGGKNMRTYIIAQNKNGSYQVEATYPNSSGNYDWYRTRCMNSACTEEFRKSAIEKLEKREIEDGKVKKGKVYENASCISAGNGFPDSHCTYHNLKFKADIDIDDMINHIGTDKITFSIRTEVDFDNYEQLSKTVRKCTGKGKKRKCTNVVEKYWGWVKRTKKKTTSIGVLSTNCGKVFGKSCKSGKTYYGTNKDNTVTRSIKVGGLSNIVRFTALQAKGYTDSSASKSRGSDFTNNSKYKILDKTGIITARGITGRLYKIKGTENKNKNQSGWAWASWIKTSGTLSMTITNTPTTGGGCGVTNGSVATCVGSNCVNTYNSETCVYSPTQKTLQSTSNSTSHNSCSSVPEFSLSNNDVYEYAAWVKIPMNDIDSRIGDYDVDYVSLDEWIERFDNGDSDIVNYLAVDDDDPENYLAYFNIWALINYTQKFSLTLNFDNNQKIPAGRPFSFSFNYKSSVSVGGYVDNYTTADTSTSGTSDYNSYASYITFRVINSSNQQEERKLGISLNVGDWIYSYNPETSQMNPLQFSDSIYKDTISYLLNSGSFNNSMGSSTNSATVTFPDTNKVTSTTSEIGRLICSNSYNCDYKLFQAYISNNGDGKVIYGEKQNGYDITRGDESLYYISPNWNKENLTFSIDAHFGRERTKFHYNATCTVSNIKNKIHGTNYVKYRSIDTSNPFPDSSKIPENWKEFQKIDSNFSRIVNNSFNTVNYQTGFFGSSIKNTLKELENSNKIGSYSSYKDVTSSGSDKLITDTDIFIVNNAVSSNNSGGNYCFAGRFNENCNQLVTGR